MMTETVVKSSREAVSDTIAKMTFFTATLSGMNEIIEKSNE